ncbi:MAG: PLP-dependent cysteine synthase family protein [Bacteroidales bacterium]|nr:PLP-dependent cysteine synthase family protein [Bacteroidales bacterium]
MTPHQRIAEVGKLVGNTPMVKITYKYKGKTNTIFAKLEYFNFSGSIKDRMAFHILSKSYAEELIKPGDHIVEATSGNTGIAFSAQGRALGHPVVIYMPDWMSKERISLINSYGAEIRLVSKEEGGFLGSIARAEDMGKNQQNVFLPCQFDNTLNCEAHFKTTGPEIWAQLHNVGLIPEIFVAGVGTGGTVMGVNEYLKKRNPNAKAHPLEPSNSPTMSTGHCVGKHRIQGISDEFIPSIVKLNQLDKIVEVDDGDSIIMAQKLATVLGLGVGISSGGNFLGAVKLQQENPDANVVTIFSDCSKKYLSTDYNKQEPVKDDFWSSDIELISKEAILVSRDDVAKQII